MIKPSISYPDFEKLDIRTGQVMAAEKIEGSKKLIKLSVDFGADYGTTEIIAGIGEWYKPESLIGNTYLFLPNLEPKTLMGHISHGMILAADTPKKPVPIKLPKSTSIGCKIR